MLFALLHDRTQFDALYNDRSLFPQAFEEVRALGAAGVRHSAPGHP